MVGDIKQSIYRFRNANPNIFKQKYENYYPITKDNYPSLQETFKNAPGYLIDMNQNLTHLFAEKRRKRFQISAPEISDF